MGMAKASIPKTAVEDAPGPKVVKVEIVQEAPKQAPPMRAGFNQPLTEYDLQQSRRIGVAGVVQAIVGSEWYAQQAALTDLSNADSVKALRDFAKQEVEYWLMVIQEKSI